MKKLILRLCLTILLLLALVTGIGWWQADQILDQYLRPQIERLANEKYAVDLTIEKLQWTDAGLALTGLELSHPDGLRLELPTLELSFNLSQLRHRQLDRLTITKPRISYTPTQQNAPVNSSNVAFPVQLPLGINSIQVIDGTLELQHQAGRILIHDIDVQTAIQQQASFQLSSYLGPGTEQPIALAGEFAIHQDPTLTLNEIQWKQTNLLTEPLVVELGALQRGSTGRLKLASLDRQQLLALLQAVDVPITLPAAFDFSLRDISLVLELSDSMPRINVLVANGTLGYQKHRLPLRNLILLLAQQETGWKIDGQLIGPADLQFSYSSRLQEKTLVGRVDLKMADVEKLSKSLMHDIPIPLQGGIELHGDYLWSGQQLSAEIDFLGTGEEQAAIENINLGTLSGGLRLQMAPNAFNYQLHLNSLQQPLFSVVGDRVNHQLTLGELNLGHLKTFLPANLFPAELTKVNRLTGSGAFQLDRSSHLSGDFRLSVAEAVISSLKLNETQFTGTLRNTPDGIQIPLLTINSQFTHQEEISGKIMANGSGLLASNRYSARIDDLSFAEMEYVSTDGNSGVSGARLRLRGDLNGAFSGPHQLDISGELQAKEALFGALYADLSGHRGIFSLLGELNPAEQSLNLQQLQFDIPESVLATGTGTLTRDEISLQGGIQLNDLAQSYGEHIGPLVQDLIPGLDKLTLEGKLTGAYQFSWTPSSWGISGLVKPQGVDVFWDIHDLEIVDGRGQLPFSITRGSPVPTLSTAAQSGELSFQSLSVALASLENSQLSLTSTPNQLELQSKLVLRLAGGTVAIDDLRLGWPATGPEGEGHINIKEVDMAKLTRELELPLMEGRFRADLGKIIYRDHQISTDGLARVHVFGGNFQLRNMRYTEPFSNYPVFHADIDFSGLDLLQATRTFDFGEMNGVLDGYIHGLKLFGSTPAAFNADIATRKRGKRNISVKALNNLSMISQGGISAALSRGIYRFIDFYRYQKIGFKCALENDTFTLTGTARSDTNRYLVYGGLLPPRIDITTTSPTISFKEMMSRISRIDRAGN